MITLTLLLICCSRLLAAPPSSPGRAVVVVVNRLALSDLIPAIDEALELPGFNRLMREGCLALMTTRTDDAGADESAFVTIGAGRRARGGWETRETFKGGELLYDLGGQLATLKEQPQAPGAATSARLLYGRRIGRGAHPDNVLCLNIGNLQTTNAKGPYKAVPGALGELLRANGIGCVVVGNADTGVQRQRAVVALPMDQWGAVANGDVGDRYLQKDPTTPYGLRTNYGHLVSDAMAHLERSRFVVVETGDTTRADQYSPTSTEPAARVLRLDAIQRIDVFLGTLCNYLDRAEDLLIVVSPNPPARFARTGNTLTPLIVWGKGYSGDSLRGLRSASTRWEGIVTNLDLAPTICDFFGIDPAGRFAGRALDPARTTRERLGALDAGVTAIETIRDPALSAFVYAQTTMFAVTMVALLLGWFGPLQTVALACSQIFVVAPAASVCSAGFAGRGTAELAIALAVSILVLYTMLSILSVNPSRRSGIIPFTLLLIGMGVAFRFLAFSFLGNSLPEGARYYGVGNELGGTCLAAALIWAGTACLPASNPEPVARANLIRAAVFGLLVSFALGYPGAGANLGNMLAALAGFAALIYSASGRAITWKTLVLLGALLVLGILIVGVGDYLIGRGQSSHLGRLTGAMGQEGGGAALVETIGRKLVLNWRLIKGSKWMPLTVSATLVFLYFTRMLPRFLYIPMQTAPSTAVPASVAPASSRPDPDFPSPPLSRPVVLGLLAALLVDLLANDSGIVSAATLSAFAAAWVVGDSLSQIRGSASEE